MEIKILGGYMNEDPRQIQSIAKSVSQHKHYWKIYLRKAQTLDFTSFVNFSRFYLK